MTGLYFYFVTLTSKYQWIFTKLAVCIDIVEIWPGIANGQISLILDNYLPTPMHILVSGQ